MSHTVLLDKLTRVVDKAASYAIQHGYPISDNAGGTWVGNAIVRKNTLGLYNVLSLDKSVLYENISVFDVAITVAQRYSNGELGTVRKIIALEDKYSQYHTEMIHYLHCLKGAKRKKDYTLMAILEDKFQASEIKAKAIKDNLSFFRKTR